MELRIIATAGKRRQPVPASWTIGWTGDRCTMVARVHGIETKRIWRVEVDSPLNPKQQMEYQLTKLKQDVEARFEQQYNKSLEVKFPFDLSMLDTKQDFMLMSKR